MSTRDTGQSFLAGGGEMGILTRAFDWSKSSLGPPHSWPQSLRLTVRLMLNSGHPMLIFWGPDLIQFYNDAYRATLGPERHPSALGQRGRECWEEIWDIIGPLIDFVMAGKGATWHEDSLVPVTRHGQRRDVWWTFSYGPIDLEGKVGGVLVVCNDVTEHHLARETLANQARHLELLFEQAPGFMAVLRGPDHIYEMTNAAYKTLVGDRDYIGKSVIEIVPEAEGQGFFHLLDQVYQTGQAHVGKRVPFALRPVAGGPTKETFLDFVYQPIRGVDGEVTGIFVEGHDTTVHVRAEQHLQLLNDELKHRVKNTLAMVGAIASQTLRGSSDADKLQAFHQRLGVFAKAHDILTATTWATAHIRDVVQTTLAPHGFEGDRLRINGPNLTIGSKQAISLTLALHELATNAAKYGAWTPSSGRVDIEWSETKGSEASIFSFSWEESGGPPVPTSRKQGFGSQLIERVLEADFSCEVKVTYDSGGLACRFSTPSENLRPVNPPPF